ncbi:MAG: hypothetical protein AABW67_05315 [Nanoarchaeota archaeon]
MKVKIGEPVGVPLINYKKDIERRFFNHQELEKLVKSVEKDLDNIIINIDNRIVILDYEILFERADTQKYLEIIKGGMDLSVEAARKYSLPYFQKRYKTAFNNILNKEINYPLNIYVSILGFGDKITHVVEAKDPK